MKFSELVRLLKRSRAGISKSSSAEILQFVSICAFGNNQSDPIDLERDIVEERPASERL
jgi:hypothetical protein